MTGICRFCIKSLSDIERYFEINEIIKNEFLNVTQTELDLSPLYSNIICELCLRSLQMAVALKAQFIENQKKFTAQERIEDIMVNMEPKIKTEPEDDINSNDPLIGVIKIEQPTVSEEPKTKKKRRQKTPKEPEYNYPEVSLEIQNVQSVAKNSFGTYQCDLCHKTFKLLKTLKQHKLLHDSSFSKDSVACPICSRRFKGPASLSSHMEHHKEPRFKCDICGKCYHKKFGIQYHITSYHLRERNFKCKFCPKAYMKNAHLLLHIQSDHEHKKYYCALCRKDFTRRENCRSHIFILHPDIPLESAESLIIE